MRKSIAIKTIFFILIFTIQLFPETAIPDTFDLRNYQDTTFVTSVKRQQGGTCWTHGTIAAIEGNLMMTGNWTAEGETGEPNLAEYHLDWWNGFNKFNNDDILPDSGGLDVHLGGDYRVSTAYLSRGEGAVRDIDGQSYESNPVRDSSSYHYYYVRNVEWYIIDSALTNIDTVKRAIMEHGVLATCYYSGEFYDGNIHYQPYSSSMDPNHSVAIVGWNDNKETQADGNGAWLIKNSWGTGAGENGYYWISYYDKHSGKHPEMGAVSFQDVEKMKYDKIYYHDYHGWRNTKSDVNKAFNAFVSKNNSSYSEEIKAVSFFNAVDEVDYTIKIYSKFNNYQLSELLTSQSGHIQHTGFHTIDLNSAITLSKNDSFFVYLEFDKGGHPYDCTSEVPVLLTPRDEIVPSEKYFLQSKSNMSNTIVTSSANAGESYYFEDEIWYDLHDFDSTANFCIKVLTNFASIETLTNSPDEFKLFQNYPNPFNSSTNIAFELNQESKVKLVIYNIQGKIITTLLNEKLSADNYSINWTPNSISSGIYIYRLTINDKSISKKCVFIK
jgi:C1A family cysteine protease